MSTIERFLGDSPFRVLVKLLAISFLVGIVMNAFGWSPYDLVDWVRYLLLDIWRNGFAALNGLARHIAVGAIIVVPVFLVLRLLRSRR